MRLVDLSHTLNSSISTYPGDPAFCCSSLATISKDGCSVHSLSLGSHSGTHVDAPYHFFEAGKRIDQLPLEWLIGRALVIDVTQIVSANYRIEWEDLESHEQSMKVLGRNEGAMVFIRTGWDQHWGTDKYRDHPFLSREAARKVMAAGIRVLGVDALSPDRTLTEEGEHSDFGVHEVVLGSGALLAENLTGLAALQNSPEGDWIVSLVPLKIEGCDGFPVRAYAYQNVREHVECCARS